jgi:hypothetical protein
MSLYKTILINKVPTPIMAAILGSTVDSSKNGKSYPPKYLDAIIALLTGLLALALFTQPAQSAPKTYDAVKLAEYTACLDAQNNFDIARMHVSGGIGGIVPSESVLVCKRFRP